MSDTSIGDVSELNPAGDAGLRIEVAPGARPGTGVGQGSPEGTAPATGALEEAIVSAQGDDTMIGDSLDDQIDRLYLGMGQSTETGGARPQPQPDLSILEQSPQAVLSGLEPAPKPPSDLFSLDTLRDFTINFSAAQAGLPPEFVTRTSRYQPIGSAGDPQKAVELDLDPFEGYYYHSPIGSMLNAIPNGFFHGIDETQEVITGKNFYELYPEYFSEDFASRETAVKPGNVPAEIAYELSAMIPPTYLALKTMGGAGAILGGTSSFAKSVHAIKKIVTAPLRPVLNPLSHRVTRLKPLNVLATQGKQAFKFGAAAVIGEQVITDREELIKQIDRGDGILVPRIGKVLAESDYPILTDLGKLIIANKDDPEMVQRALKAADDLLIGMVFDSGVYSATFLGHKVLQKAGLIKDKTKVIEAPETTTDLPTNEQLEDLLEKTVQQKPDAFSIEEFEEMAKYLYEDGGMLKIERMLQKAGVEYGPLQKMFGSINITKIQASEMESIYFIKHFADIAKEEAEKAGKAFPPTKSYQATQADAELFGYENKEQLTEALLRMNADGTPLKMHSYMSGVELGAGLEGLDVYVMAAREALVYSSDHLARMAREAITSQTSKDPLERSAGKAAFLQAYMAHGRLQETVSGIANQAGRVLSSFNAPVTGAVKIDYVNRIVAEAGGDLDKVMKALAAADAGPAERARIIREFNQNNSSLFDKIGTLWYNSILSGIDTQVVNLAGGLFVRAMTDIFETPAAALVNEGKKKLGIEVEPGGVMMEDAKARLRSYPSKTSLGTFYNESVLDSRVIEMLNSGRLNELLGAPSQLKDGLTNIKQVHEFLIDQGVTNPRVRLQALARREIEMETLAGSINAIKALRFFARAYMGDPKTLRRFQSGNSEFVEKAGPNYDVVAGNTVRNKLSQGAGHFFTVAGRTMTGMDTALKSLSQNGALFEGASRMIRNMRYQMEKNGEKEIRIRMGDGKMMTVTAEMLDPNTAGGQLVADLMQKIVSDPPRSLLDEAARQMQKDVFQQSTNITRRMDSLRRFMDIKIGDVKVAPIGTILMPFIRTPINLVTYTMDRIPLMARYSRENREALSTPGAARDMQIARQRVGMAILASFYAAAEAGYIIGAEPPGVKPTQRQTLRGTGFRKDSIYDPETGKYYPINRFDPASMMAGIAARIHAAVQTFKTAPGLSEAEKKNASHRLLLSANELFSSMLTLFDDKLYIQNLVNFAQAFQNPYNLEGQDLKRKIAKGSGQVIGSAAAGAVPYSAFIRRAEEAYAKLTDMDHEKFRNLDTESRKKLIVDGMAMYEAKYMYDARIREATIMQDYTDVFLAHLVRSTPMLNKVFDYQLYPKVDQFGNELTRDKPVPVGVPMTRTTGEPDPIQQTEDGTVVYDEFAGISAILLHYGIDDLRTSKEVEFSDGTKLPLSGSEYYYRQRIQGSKYAQLLGQFLRTEQAQRSVIDGGLPPEAIINRIKNIRSLAVQHGTAKTMHLLGRIGDKRVLKIKDIKELTKEVDKAEKKALSQFSQLQKSIQEQEKIYLTAREDE